MRFRGALNDLWLDELISIHNAKTLQNIWQVFTGIHADNNHYLNTVWLYLVGDGDSALRYRMLSLAFGVASIPAAFWAVAKRSRTVQIVFTCLVAFSYPLVHFSSEARGYSGAILAGLLAFGALEGWQSEEQAQGRWVALFGVAVCLGILFHLTFIFVWTALAAWSLAAVSPLTWLAFRRWTALHAAPALLFIVLGWADLRHLSTLGGPRYGRAYVVARLAALSLGWPLRDGWSVGILAAPLAALGSWTLLRMRRLGDRSWIFFAVLLILPVFFLLAVHPEVTFPRYFMVIVPFAYLLLALAGSNLRPMIWSVLLAIFVAGNLYLYASFLRVGRGDFSSALSTIVRRTQPKTIVIASDNDYRSGIELEYYQRQLPPGRELVFVQHEQLRQATPEWVVLHREALDPATPTTLVQGDKQWEKIASFPCSELSGQVWVLYQLQAHAASGRGR